MSPAVFLQYVLPHQLLSKLAYAAARWQWRPWKQWLINTVIGRFQVDMSLAENPDPNSYPSFNAFFTRPLRQGARNADPDPASLLCPADGKIAQIGRIDGDAIFQAKGHHFNASTLLGSEQAALPFVNGWFANIYLSPRDYHRVHMPWAGQLTHTVHIPGRLFSVAPWAARAIPGLFARNERLVCFFDTDLGPMVSVMVGAILVSGIETVWSGEEVPPYASTVTRKDWRGSNIRLERFAEMARFNYGSTVILLFPADSVTLDHIAAETEVKVGQRIGMRQIH